MPNKKLKKNNILNEKQVAEIAYLARLVVSSEQLENYVSDLNNIFDLFEQLKKVNTENIEPMAHPLNACQYLREDKVTEKNEVKHLQSCAPKISEKYYIVPKVIE